MERVIAWVVLAVAVPVVVVAYVVIIGAARGSPRELAWTLLPAALLAVLLVATARAAGFGLP